MALVLLLITACLTAVSGLFIVACLALLLRRRGAELAAARRLAVQAQARYDELSSSYNSLCAGYSSLTYSYAELLEAHKGAEERTRRVLELGESLLRAVSQTPAGSQPPRSGWRTSATPAWRASTNPTSLPRPGHKFPPGLQAPL